MTVLLLQLSGPLQSWGDASRFKRRTTRREPTKSGVVGLLASALGRSREESVADLAQLEFGVRSDQPGTIVRDFQSEKSFDGRKVMPLSHRYYLADAKFLVALGGDEGLLHRLDAALRSPRWPLYLGRRSCPPDAPLSRGVHEEYATVREALGSEPWIASEWYRRKHGEVSALEIACDAHDGELCVSQADYPLEFSLTTRRYTCRPVYRYSTPNPDVASACRTASVGESVAFIADADADPFSFV